MLKHSRCDVDGELHSAASRNWKCASLVALVLGCICKRGHAGETPALQKRTQKEFSLGSIDFQGKIAYDPT
uniref:Uncharacterized protein n=1 Tax=Candidatus Kentrum sp. SD TaxID=2126332 RepID=A0A451BM07_9GAMM|nr:MAG: hypothetical protein BECKSD772D_GA0070982_104324 [Candidatus Kentron sp. SD]